MQIVLFNPQNNPTEAYYYPRFTDEETEAQTQPVACPESRSRSRPRPSDLSATLPFVKKMRLRSEKGAQAGGSVARQGHEALRQGDSASKRAQTPTGPLRPVPRVPVYKWTDATTPRKECVPPGGSEKEGSAFPKGQPDQGKTLLCSPQTSRPKTTGKPNIRTTTQGPFRPFLLGVLAPPQEAALAFLSAS